MKRVIKKLIKTSDGRLTASYVIIDERDMDDQGSEIHCGQSQNDAVYFCADRAAIRGYEIERPLVYIGSNRELDLAIDAARPVSNENNRRYVNYNFISATYGDYSEYERHLYLSWLASGKKSSASEKILTLYLRNLQRRAVIEGQDQDLILFEIVNIFDRYSNKISHHFGDNYLPLFVYLVFKRETKFSEEEQKILENFIEKYRHVKHIAEAREDLLFKIKGDETQNLSAPLILKSDDINKKIDFIFEYIIGKDIHNSNSKFYKGLDKTMLLRMFRDRPILCAIFRILLYNNRNILNEENLKPEIKKKEMIYKNYYFYSGEKYYYTAGEEIVLNIGMSIKKIFHEAIDMTASYISDIKMLQSDKKCLEDEDRYKVLPQLLKDYFKGILPANAALRDSGANVLKRKIDGRTITDRMRMCFNGLGIKTFGDLVQKTGKELLEFEGFGQSSLKDVRNYLEVFGLSLRLEERVIKRKKEKAKKLAPSDIKIEFLIDREKLSQIREDTIGVKNVLTEIFIEDDGEEKKIAEKENPGHLDKKYVDFIDFVRKKEVWNRKELVDYCKNNKLMLNDAVSVANEYWDEKYGEYLMEEEGGGFVVNDI
ncbi:MAG: TerB N-terminal domain-containing protein [Rickettsiales bacterium]|jgi:hypothetical protein|nr:TerB N-terminal domain-containing protein [Rickettsiales bacterium]